MRVMPSSRISRDGDLVGPLAVVDGERPPAPRRLGADEEGAADAHQRERAAELVDGGDPMVAGVARAVEFDRPCRPSPSVPDVGLWTPERILISVDLPAPLSPSRHSTSPAMHLERDVVQHVDRTERLVDVRSA